MTTRNVYQKTTNSGKLVVTSAGLPVFTKNIEHRLKTLKEMLTISMNKNDAKWYNIQLSLKIS